MSLKAAATRSVKEWRSASGLDPRTGLAPAEAAIAGSGQTLDSGLNRLQRIQSQVKPDAAFADQIAQSSGQLGLKPRFVENISEGGMEAGVDKMIGRAMGPEVNQSGYLAQKVYKPDSPIATGKNMSTLLDRKQDMTNEARSLSPAAKDMVPAMYGHKEIQGPQGQLRHVSQHEYVPGATSLRRDPNALSHIENIENTVSKPMAARGREMGDIPRLVGAKGGTGPVGMGGNLSNAVMTPRGPKVIDFLPGAMGGTSTKPGGLGILGVHKRGIHDLVGTDLGSGAANTAFNKKKQMSALRQDVFRPGSATKAVAPATKMPGATMLATKLERPAANAATVLAKKPAATLMNAATKVLGKVAHMNFTSFCEELVDYQHALPIQKTADEAPKDNLYQQVAAKMPHLVAKKPESPKQEEKKAGIDWKALGTVGAMGAGFGAAAMGGALISVGPQGRKRINKEVHDPRLYSNIRGTFEPVKDRIAAHKKLDRSKDHTVWSAMKEGWTRGGDREKNSSVMGSVGGALANKGGVLSRMGEHLVSHGNAYDLAGLGLLAAPSAITMGQQIKRRVVDGKPMDMSQVGHDSAELAGLGLIAAPVAAASFLGKAH